MFIFVKNAFGVKFLIAKATVANTAVKTGNNQNSNKILTMLARGPTCALARVNFMGSTRTKA